MISVMVTPRRSSTSTTSPRATKRLLTKMSIASPTLRSSSSTAPGASLRRSPTGMRALPSTAETVTGTSKTCSRSAALFALTGASSVPTASGSASSRRGSCRSLSWAIAVPIWSGGGFGLRRAGVRRGLEPGPVADDAAVGPFEARVAERDVGLAEHHDAALEAALAGKPLQHRVDLLDEGVVDANGEMRHGAKVLQRRARRCGDRPERVRVERL